MIIVCLIPNAEIAFIFTCNYDVYVHRDGVAVDRIIGFQELGGVDDFTTKALESRLLKAGIQNRSFLDGFYQDVVFDHVLHLNI